MSGSRCTMLVGEGLSREMQGENLAQCFLSAQSVGPMDLDCISLKPQLGARHCAGMCSLNLPTEEVSSLLCPQDVDEDTGSER